MRAKQQQPSRVQQVIIVVQHAPSDEVKRGPHQFVDHPERPDLVERKIAAAGGRAQASGDGENHGKNDD